MRYTLTIGLLVCMPTVALLAVAGAAVLAGNLRHRLGRATDPQRRGRGMAHAYISGISGLQFTSGPDQDQLDQLHDESLPCRLTGG